jgi:hypothetical protein
MVIGHETFHATNGVSEPRVGKEEWAMAAGLLRQLLERAEDGCVGSIVVGRELTKKGIADPRRLVLALKFHDFEAPPDENQPHPGFTWRHHGRSFYTEDAFRSTLTRTETQAESAAEKAAVPLVSTPDEDDEDDSEPAPIKRSKRTEEARLVTYVIEALTDIYDSEYAPDRKDIAFDVHNERAGSDFENVDALAIHWRSKEVVDLIAVEVKLSFSARLAQQANNYRRFADRVWAALPVQAPVGRAALELRETNGRLFDYLISLGVGILACHKRRGKSYEVFPVQWPQRCHPDPIERHEFIERHYQTFEDAGVVAPRSRGVFPRLR